MYVAIHETRSLSIYSNHVCQVRIAFEVIHLHNLLLFFFFKNKIIESKIYKLCKMMKQNM